MADVAGWPGGRGTRPGAGRAARRQDRQPGARLRPGAEVPGRGGHEDEARAQTIQATRRFARRQEAWFRRDPRVIWLDAVRVDLVSAALATFDSCSSPGRLPSASPPLHLEFNQQFAKGHGTENDFVILPDPTASMTSRRPRRPLCDRRAGIGADGVLRVVRTAALPARRPARAGCRRRVVHGLPQRRRQHRRDVRQRRPRVRPLPAGPGPGRRPAFAVATRSGIRQVRAEPDGHITVDMGPARSSARVSRDQRRDPGRPAGWRRQPAPGLSGGRPAGRFRPDRRAWARPGGFPGRRQRGTRPAHRPRRGPDAGTRAWFGRDPVLRARAVAAAPPPLRAKAGRAPGHGR